MTIVARNGFAGAVGNLLLVPAGQSVVIGNPGPGIAKLSSAPFVNNQLPPLFSIKAAILPNTASYTTFAAATYVLIEAPANNDIEYVVGVAPCLVVYPIYAANTLTALAGGGQTGATLLANISRITVCATTADSCKLPSALPGADCEGVNLGAASTTIYPQTGEAINSGSANAGFAVGAGKGFRFTCSVAGTWNAMLGA